MWQTLGHEYFRKASSEFQYLLPTKALLDASEETIVDVLPNPSKAFALVALVEWHVPIHIQAA